jgi:hypothetical protein
VKTAALNQIKQPVRRGDKGGSVRIHLMKASLPVWRLSVKSKPLHAYSQETHRLSPLAMGI